MSENTSPESTSPKVALVTGGSRGIGKGCVLALAKVGFHVVFSYVSNPTAAEALEQEVAALGQTAVGIKADVADATSATQLVEEATKRFGRLDALVNNAGVTRDNLLIRMKDEEWDTVIDTNLSGVFYMMRAAAKVMMKQRYGTIINMTSVSGVHGNPGQMNYAASKAGVIGMTKTAAKELASRHITVNAIAPGLIETDMTAGLDTSKILEHIPLGRLGKIEDIADAVVFLVTSGHYITGQVLQVDGGLIL